MHQKTFTSIAGVFFALITALHACRLLLGWQAVIGGWMVPAWVSGVAVAVFGALAYCAFRVGK